MIERYDYEWGVMNSLKRWITSETDILDNREVYGTDQELAWWIEDEVWDKDDITGNGDFAYDNENQCSTYLAGNTELLYEALSEMDPDNNEMSLLEHYRQQDLMQYFDTCIRCYVLRECIKYVMEDLHLNIDNKGE